MTEFPEAVVGLIRVALKELRVRLGEAMGGCLLESGVLASLPSGQGKLLRPSLLILMGKLNGTSCPDLVDAGAALELIHVASLFTMTSSTNP